MALVLARRVPLQGKVQRRLLARAGPADLDLPKTTRILKRKRIEDDVVEQSGKRLGLGIVARSSQCTSAVMPLVTSKLAKTESYLPERDTKQPRQTGGAGQLQRLRQAALAPRRGQLSALEANAVRPATAASYQETLRHFEEWGRNQGLEIRYEEADQLTERVLEYFDWLCFDQRKGVGEGSRLAAALGHFYPTYCRGIKRGPLARLERALRGWERVIPSGSVDALPEPLVYAVAMEMARLGKWSMALRTVLTVDAYLRPGVASALRRENLIPPQPSLGPGGRHWSLHLNRREDNVRSKVGIFDDSVVLDSPDRQWLNPLLASLYRSKQPDELLFDEPMSEWAKIFNQALKRLGVAPTVLYALRHSGPSIDMLNKTRDLASVKRRGCWAADSSVRRYEKAAKTMSLSKKFSGELKTHLMTCRRLLPRVLHRLEAPVHFAGVYRDPTMHKV